MSEAMSPNEVRGALADLPAWSLENGKLHREVKFRDFAEALAFLVRVGIEAEKLGHHPELGNVYSRVTIDLTSHDAGGVTDKDVSLAKAIDGVMDR
jgi:4a-hydroxytetrahydrobiopterin dehydratase